jgi:two-component system nitrogen regulation response regulator GlnG
MVLLLDDDEGFRTALGELLREDGHSVRAYGSITEMPPLDEITGPAALITDYQLGGSEDGLAFAQRFHAAHPRVPVILATAFATDYLTQAVDALPYVSLIRKPLDYGHLHTLLHTRAPASE